jgi:hypothetical protein
MFEIKMLEIIILTYFNIIFHQNPFLTWDIHHRYSFLCSRKLVAILVKRLVNTTSSMTSVNEQVTGPGGVYFFAMSTILSNESLPVSKPKRTVCRYIGEL